METIIPNLNCILIDNSDPTYEAWKLAIPLEGMLSPRYSDPTYEAWKLVLTAILYASRKPLRSYL